MDNDPRYEPVKTALPEVLPPITRDEARRAAYRLKKKFGKQKDASPNVVGDFFPSRKVCRRCWISTKPTTGHFKGWGRLIHDVSHTIFTYRHPTFRPHDGGHATLEREMAQYVASSGWLTGSLKPKVPTMDDKRAARLAKTEAAIERWDAKLRRAQNAIRKLRRRQAALRR